MEHEIMITGVGGQGVQLGAQVLARAAVLEDRQVMTLGTYGGTMRGGNTDSTMVIADGPISSPPIVSKLGCGLAMHHLFWEPVVKRLRPGALVLINSTVFEGEVGRDDVRVLEVPATRIATDLGNLLGASMVFVGAFACLTNLVGIESLVAAMRSSVPSYRQQHITGNEKALRAGFDAVEPGQVPSWPIESGHFEGATS